MHDDGTDQAALLYASRGEATCVRVSCCCLQLYVPSHPLTLLRTEMTHNHVREVSAHAVCRVSFICFNEFSAGCCCRAHCRYRYAARGMCVGSNTHAATMPCMPVCTASMLYHLGCHRQPVQTLHPDDDATNLGRWRQRPINDYLTGVPSPIHANRPPPHSPWFSMHLVQRART